MPKALDVKPGQKFRLKNPRLRDVVYIRPEVVLDGPVLWIAEGKIYTSVLSVGDGKIMNYQEYFFDNPEVILTDEKITI